ncbi:MAG: NAD-dependent epimerase/dehydratase family protein [Acidimicrobiia bacterium]
MTSRNRSSERVAVLGAGFLGSHLAASLGASGVPTRLLSRSGTPPGLPLAGVDVVTGDIENRAALDPALEGATEVVYAAGGLLPAESQRDPGGDVRLTLDPLIAALEAMRARPGTRFTVLSSGGTVYGRPRYLPVDEDHPTEPISAYGVLKLAGEHYVRMYRQLYDVSARVLRCSNVYGEHQAPDRTQGAVGAFMHRVARGESLAVYGDGGIVRDYLYVGDLASVVLALLGNDRAPTVLNVGSGVGTSLAELIDLIGETTGEAVTVDHEPARPLDVDAIVLDVTRLQDAVGFTPVPLADGVARVWAAMRTETAASRLR